jgi:hypothetical protein
MPHNIGISATRDPELAERTGAVTAAEVRATGIPWDFAPCLCVTRQELEAVHLAPYDDAVERASARSCLRTPPSTWPATAGARSGRTPAPTC